MTCHHENGFGFDGERIKKTVPDDRGYIFLRKEHCVDCGMPRLVVEEKK